MILRPGRNVWRTERAHRTAVIVDAAAYFAAVRAALLNARRRAFIIGWDIHSQTRLVGPDGRADDGFPENLAEFLSALVEKRPGLEVCLLLWDFAVLYAAERELFPTYTFRWNTPKRVKFHLDNAVPFGSSQHQKLIVIDDALAFTGGLDITIRRWDTSEHLIGNPLRRDPDGHPYAPFHDVQMLVDGPAARALAELAHARWECAAHEPVPRVDADGNPWPGGVTPDFTDIDLGIARTQPRYEGQEQVHEIEALFLDSIAAAERTIYIENQFLSRIPVAKALAERMRACRELETLIVAPATHASWIEARTMRNGRIHFVQVLRDAGVADRVRLVSPAVSGGGETARTMVHSKVMVVDDHVLHVGSANLNNRSMGTDTECDIVIAAASAADRAGILAVRDRLIGDHCGVTAADVAGALAADGKLTTLPERLSANGHRLVDIDDGAPDDNEWAAYLHGLADPEKPIGVEEFVPEFLGGAPSRRHLMNFLKIAAACLVLLGLVLLWEFSPLAELARPERVRQALQDFGQGPWGPLAVIVAFAAGSVLMFPVTILIAATAAAFGPWLGFAYALIGTIASAVVSYALGRLLGRDALRDVLGPRLNRLREKVRHKGVIAIALIRMVPVAPFGVINLAAGASDIRLVDFVLGTVIGMLPGIIALAALGHQISQMISNPSAAAFAWLGLAVVAWIALSFGVQAVVSKFEGERT